MTYALAQCLGLVGTPISYWMKTVHMDAYVPRMGYVYTLNLIDNNRNIVSIRAYDQETMTQGGLVPQHQGGAHLDWSYAS